MHKLCQYILPSVPGQSRAPLTKTSTVVMNKMLHTIAPEPKARLTFKDCSQNPHVEGWCSLTMLSLALDSVSLRQSCRLVPEEVGHIQKEFTLLKRNYIQALWDVAVSPVPLPGIGARLVKL